MYRQNLYKSSYVLVDSEDVRVIDSNTRVVGGDQFMPKEEPITDDMVQEYMPQSFDENEEQVAMLFGETPDEENVDESSDFLQEGMEGMPEQMLAGDEADMDDNMSSNEISQEAQAILEQAQLQAQEIVEQAMRDAENEVNLAYENAKQQGMQDGYEQGRQRLEEELNARMLELEQMEIERKNKYDEMVSEMEPYIVQQLTGIYEHLIGVELSQYKSVLSHLIAGTLHNTEASDNYLIHVSSNDYSYVSMQKNQILEEGGVKNASIEVVEDLTLSKNQCLIETDSGIYDCSLSVQLEELKRKLMLLSYGHLQ